MNKQEAYAFKVALLWQEIASKEFPDDKFVKLRRTGDPRKSTLFKYCYKLVTSTQGILLPTEYRFYVLAQIQLMGRMQSGDFHALLEPQILVGPKAWKRWRWWKERYDKNMRRMNKSSTDLKLTPQIENVKIDLIRTYDFLFSQVGVLTSEKIKKLIESKKLQEWLVTDKISPYFVILSPWVQEYLGEKSISQVFERDLTIYLITEEIERVFLTTLPINNITQIAK